MDQRSVELSVMHARKVAEDRQPSRSVKRRTRICPTFRSVEEQHTNPKTSATHNYNGYCFSSFFYAVGL